MTNLKLFTVLFTMFAAISCNNQTSNNITEDQIDDFKHQLTAKDIFWQSYYEQAVNGGNLVDYQFSRDGSLVAVMGNETNKKLVGKWRFDKSKATLQISWEKGNQYLVQVKEITSDWSEIRFSDSFHEFGSTQIRKMKLFDTDRFNQ